MPSHHSELSSQADGRPDGWPDTCGFETSGCSQEKICLRLVVESPLAPTPFETHIPCSSTQPDPDSRNTHTASRDLLKYEWASARALCGERQPLSLTWLAHRSTYFRQVTSRERRLLLLSPQRFRVLARPCRVANSKLDVSITRAISKPLQRAWRISSEPAQMSRPSSGCRSC